MLRRFGPLALFIVVGLAGFSRPVLACSCLSSGPPCQAYWKTDAVFDATVLGISPLNPAEPLPGGDLRFAAKIVKLDVRESWKGVDTGPLEIMTSGEGGNVRISIQGRRTLPDLRIPRPSRRAAACVHLQPHPGVQRARRRGRLSGLLERPRERRARIRHRPYSPASVRPRAIAHRIEHRNPGAARRWRAGTDVRVRQMADSSSPGFRRGHTVWTSWFPRGMRHIPRVATFRFPIRVAAPRKTSRSHPPGGLPGALSGLMAAASGVSGSR